jgi:hypothetical protein
LPVIRDHLDHRTGHPCNAHEVMGRHGVGRRPPEPQGPSGDQCASQA